MVVYGSGRHRFRPVDGWGFGKAGRVPGGYVPGVVSDSADRVYLLVRAAVPVLVYDRDGVFLHSWGEGLFSDPHGIWIDPSDILYISDRGNHSVRRFTTRGALLGSMGMTFRTPNKAVAGRSGEVYVVDGGPRMVHKIPAGGEPVLSWGTSGKGQGEFALAHSVAIDGRRRILVGDRENDRIQIFDERGRYIREWPVPKPNDIFVDRGGDVYVLEEENGAVTVFDPDGEVLCRWGEKGHAPGQFRSFVHSLWLDSRGDLYVTELHSDDLVHKFERIP